MIWAGSRDYGMLSASVVAVSGGPGRLTSGGHG